MRARRIQKSVSSRALLSYQKDFKKFAFSLAFFFGSISFLPRLLLLSAPSLAWGGLSIGSGLIMHSRGLVYTEVSQLNTSVEQLLGEYKALRFQGFVQRVG